MRKINIVEYLWILCTNLFNFLMVSYFSGYDKDVTSKNVHLSINLPKMVYFEDFPFCIIKLAILCFCHSINVYSDNSRLFLYAINKGPTFFIKKPLKWYIIENAHKYIFSVTNIPLSWQMIKKKDQKFRFMGGCAFLYCSTFDKRNTVLSKKP